MRIVKSGSDSGERSIPKLHSVPREMCVIHQGWAILYLQGTERRKAAGGPCGLLSENTSGPSAVAAYGLG